MSSSAETVRFASGCQVVASGALDADNAADAGGGSGSLSRGTAVSAGGMWLGTSVLPPGHSSASHHHNDQTTIVCIIAGQMTFFIEGPEGAEEFTVSPGQIAVVPGGLTHRETNPGSVDCVCVVTRNAEQPVVVNVAGADA